MDIATLRERVQRGQYLVRSHAVIHALKEGFDRSDMVEAVMTGMIIEGYPEDERVLVCGKTSLTERRPVYLHVVCEYGDPNYIEFITAHIPNVYGWVCPEDGEVAYPPETVDELIDTVRELVELAKRARQRRSALTEYIVSVG